MKGIEQFLVWTDMYNSHGQLSSLHSSITSHPVTQATTPTNPIESHTITQLADKMDGWVLVVGVTGMKFSASLQGGAIQIWTSSPWHFTRLDLHHRPPLFPPPEEIILDHCVRSGS